MDGGVGVEEDSSYYVMKMVGKVRNKSVELQDKQKKNTHSTVAAYHDINSVGFDGEDFLGNPWRDTMDIGGS